jgi:hypothetical protein
MSRRSRYARAQQSGLRTGRGGGARRDPGSATAGSAITRPTTALPPVQPHLDERAAPPAAAVIRQPEAPPDVIPTDGHASRSDDAPAAAPVTSQVNGSVNGNVIGSAGCTAPQLRRFIKSRSYVPMHELRRRFGINGTEDDVTLVEMDGHHIFVGLPSREGQLLGELLRGGDVGFELSMDPLSPVVVGVYPMRPVPRP